MNDRPDNPTPDTPQVLLEHHLKTLRLPTILSEYDKVARQCAAEQIDYPRYMELARCEFLSRTENLLLLGNSGTGKTHIALALGLSACQRGHRVRFTPAAARVSELIEARDDKHLLRFQKQLASYELLIVDELGYVPLSKTGAELLFDQNQLEGTAPCKRDGPLQVRPTPR
jgi:DNA replication protein DnaC